MPTTIMTRLLAGTAVSALLTGAAFAADANARPYDIPQQDAATALQAYAMQSGKQVLFPFEAVKGKQAPQIKGDYSDSEVLALLAGSAGLRVTADDGKTVTLRPQAAAAPEGGADAGTVQALIVTAQKREEDIQDVPIAISAFTQEDLTRSQVAGGPDLMTQVPNMTFTKTNFSSYSIQLRGIGTQAISATTDPAVAVAFNNTPFVRNRFFEQEFYDLARVEVLRGPQGTLYGRNATAGVVNIISQKPKFSYEARLAADVANYSSSRLEGMINVPLVDDVVALRIAGAWTKREGFATNQLTGNPIDGRDLWSTRTTLRFTPTDRLDLNLIWEHFEENDDRIRSGKQLCHKDIVTQVGGLPVTYTGSFPGAQKTYYQSQLSQGCAPASLYAPESFETPNGFQLAFYHPLGAIGLPTNPAMHAVDPYVNATQSRDLRVIESMVDPKYKAKNDTVELQFTYDLTDHLSLSSETAWATDMVWSTQDYNRFNTKAGVWSDSDPRPGVLNDGVFCDPQIGCSDRLVVMDLATGDSNQFNQEFRLASNYGSKFNFSLGANFTRLDSMGKYYVFSNAFNVWAATNFASKLTSEYIPGVSDNHECLFDGMKPITLDNYGGVGVSGACRYIDPNPLESLNDQGHTYFLSKNPYKLISYAVFGEAYYNITDNLKVTAGLRWTVDKKDAPRIPSWVLAGDIGYPVAEIIKQEWREPTGRLTVDWKPDLAFTDDTLLYASYAHGYKAGGANPPVAGVALNVVTADGVPTTSATHPKTFDAEFINAYEVGTKNTLLDGRMTLNLAAFYYDYKGYQISQIVDRSALNDNFDAEVWGLEVEADWRPLENLRFGLKLGYENTRVADGMKAVDVMDRSDGNRVGYLPDGTEFHWIVVKPFPVYPSNCVMPDYLWTGTGTVTQVGNPAGSADGPCDMAYFRGVDPITNAPYVPNPTTVGPGLGSSLYNWPIYPNPGYYRGFDPASAPNNGEGFDKDLSGNELPNAPHYTATLTADYSIPLPSAWLMTLHTDLYYQSEAWTRIFNTPGYDKLKAYTNVNLAAIFTNEDAGWKVMAYVKNVMDRDSITGAFLNSDDTGLTTNVFLTEPRIYGLRVTKEFQGGPWWTGGGSSHEGPYPLTVEISGMVQRQDAPYETFGPSFAGAFSDTINTLDQTEHRNLDWGDGRDLRITWRPATGPWTLSGAIRYGRANNDTARTRAEEPGIGGCGFTDIFPQAVYCAPQYRDDPFYAGIYGYSTNWSDTTVRNREEHEVADFRVGRDLGIGSDLISSSNVELGVRYAQLVSKTDLTMNGVPNWEVADGWFIDRVLGTSKYPSSFTRYESDLHVERKFKGFGPMVSWQAAAPLLGDAAKGRVLLDWDLAGGALFGTQETKVTGIEAVGNFSGAFDPFFANTGIPYVLDVPTTTEPISGRRSKAVTVPVLDLSLGLSYEVQRVKIGAGYRWERYFDALDVGAADERKEGDRTIDGPYFKIAVGFGG